MANIRGSPSFNDARYRGTYNEYPQRDPFELEPTSSLITYSIFPFRALDSAEVRELYEMSPAEFDIEYTSAIARGNYIATSMQAGLRKQFRQKTNRDNDLEALLDLPLELILEVFAHLHPLDLYNLIRTTKSIRNVLLTKKASAPVWDSAFQRHPNVLPYPTDVSPPKWVSLLFGPATCDLCHRKNAMPDFTYRRRFCKDCLSEICRHSEDLTSSIDLVSHFPYQEEEALFLLVRYTYKSNAMTYPDEYSYLKEPRYWIEDVHSKAEEMAAYLEAIREDIPGAGKYYRAFKAKSRKENLQYLKHIRICNDWCLSVYRSLDSAYTQRVISSATWARRLLIKRGHEDRDVDLTRILSHFRNYFRNAQHIQFSKKELYKHLASLEKIANAEREARLKRERLEITHRLEMKIASFYNTLVQTTVPPELWDYIPDEDRVLKLSSVVSYTQGLYDATNVPDFPTTEMGTVIMNFVNDWVREKRRHLVRTLSTSHPASSVWSGSADESILDLATAVFTHPICTRSHCSAGHGIFIGWEEAGMHASCTEPLQDSMKTYDTGTVYDFCFSKPAYDTIVLLIRLLDWDPHAALASDVDALKKRFICMRCPLTSEQGSYVMDWRECAYHSVTFENTKHDLPRFALLTDEITESVLFHETDRYPLASATIWSCKYCPDNFNSPVTKKKATAHVSQKHKIGHPVEGIDYFYRRNKTRHTGKQHFLMQGDNSDRRCMLCQGPSRVRLWTHDALLTHLRQRHKITNPVEDIHWRCPQLISRTTDEVEGDHN